MTGLGPYQKTLYSVDKLNVMKYFSDFIGEESQGLQIHYILKIN